MTRYPVLSRLDYDNTLFDPDDPRTPQTVDLDVETAEALIALGVVGGPLDKVASTPAAPSAPVSAEPDADAKKKGA